MEIIRDMIFVNQVEKRLGRSLTMEELTSDEFLVRFPDGHSEFVEIPQLEFPYDLLTRPEDHYISETSELLDAA